MLGGPSCSHVLSGKKGLPQLAKCAMIAGFIELQKYFQVDLELQVQITCTFTGVPYIL